MSLFTQIKLTKVCYYRSLNKFFPNVQPESTSKHQNLPIMKADNKNDK